VHPEPDWHAEPTAYDSQVTTDTASRSTLRGGAVIAVALAVMNLSTYGFTFLAARMLGPAEYGPLARVMSVLLVVNVLSLGLQATGARRVSAAPHESAGIEDEVMRTSYATAAVLGVLLLVATPVLSLTLNLESWGAAALIAVCAVPLSVMGGQAGILQGERRWTPLAAVYIAMGVGRLGFGIVTLLVRADASSAMVGVAVGAFVPVVVGWLALRRPSRRAGRSATSPPSPGARWAPGGVLRETLHNSHALLAFFALSSTDVIIAGATLSKHQAGLYAGGQLLTKAVLFLPQFVVVVAFPSMSREDGRRRMQLMSLGLVAVIGTVTTLGVAVLSSLAVLFVGGSEYSDLQGRLWVFAVLGTLLALLQLLVYDVVARQHQRMVFVVWVAMGALVASAFVIGSLTQLLTTVVVIDALLFVVLLLASLRPGATPAAPAVEAPTAEAGAAVA